MFGGSKIKWRFAYKTIKRTKDKVVIIKPLKSEVLALDIATHTGFHSAQGSGTWDFSECWKRNHNKQHKAFRDTVKGFIERHGIKMVVAEDVNVNKHFTDSRKLSEFRGILLEICDELDLPEPFFVNVSTLKKWATGDGKAPKDKMIKFCIDRWGIVPVDDNQADAIHLYMYYVISRNLSTFNANT